MGRYMMPGVSSVESPERRAVARTSKRRDRAARALRCAPVRLPFFLALRDRGVSLAELTGSGGCDRGYTAVPMGELAMDNALLWLIQVGVLRREVDGQGLTDSFRLTPLGWDLVADWEAGGNRWQALCPGDRLKNFVTRWVRFPV